MSVCSRKCCGRNKCNIILPSEARLSNIIRREREGRDYIPSCLNEHVESCHRNRNNLPSLVRAKEIKETEIRFKQPCIKCRQLNRLGRVYPEKPLGPPVFAQMPSHALRDRVNQSEREFKEPECYATRLLFSLDDKSKR